MKRLAVVAALAACHAKGPPTTTTTVVVAPLVAPQCKFATDDDAKAAFVRAATAQLGDQTSHFHLPEDRDETPDPDPDVAAFNAKLDPGDRLQIFYPKSFKNAVVIVYQFGNDGIYSRGVAGAFIDCAYVPIAPGFHNPQDEDPTRAEPLLALGWKSAPDRKAVALHYVLDVLLAPVDVIAESTPDFGATYVGDKQKPVKTPVFIPPTATPSGDGSMTVDVWTKRGPTMATGEDDGTHYVRLRYAIRPTGEATVKEGTEFWGVPPSQQKR